MFKNTKIAFKYKSDWQLKKSKLIFKFISNLFFSKFLIPTIGFLVRKKIPIITFLVKKTVFEQFCGGENKKECIKVIEKIHSYGVYSVLDYSVEGKSNEEDFDKIYKETLENIYFAEKKKSIPFIVFKPTGIGNVKIYEKISNKNDLNEEEQNSWEKIKNRFEGLCKKSCEKKVFVLIDAEESWIQPAIDDLAEKMMKKYNKEKCYIYNTLQMYRWGRLEYLKKSHIKSLKENYFIGYKIVRGAYMEKERERSIINNYIDPIQNNKEYTDKDFNDAISYIINNINKKISIFIGTHNEKSCELAVNIIKKNNIDNNNKNIWFGQLYGMSDNISFILSKNGYNVAKYLPYGPIQETVPYLIRRSEENSSISGQTNREYSLITKEINRRNKYNKNK
ncbi:proline dehydrogenase family protein [Candidatus Shikimatogenerans silvanidophilus]|uniref:proline dehydrogenase family protein n=1 Tax=Candidatus Shikimatogenerans silvanidophilus TaxID=2782547 RepID=UPI001BAB0BA0|nr:proline dehydrogenase family protein [Candidatus Shikimatogenerans silvanidophilus]